MLEDVGMRRIKRSLLAVIVGGVMLVTLVAPVLGAANPKASCLGFGSSRDATSAPGARAAIAHFIIDVEAPALGVTPGSLYSFFAKLHLAEACFEGE